METVDRKELMRKNIRNYFKNYADSVGLTEKSRVISENFIEQDFYFNSRVIMVYMPLADEVNVIPIIQHALKNGKKIVVPKCDTNKSIIKPIEVQDIEKDLVEGFASILEPHKEVFFDPDKIDLIIVPGRAFDENGCRLGRGKGYYDKFLRNNNKSLKVGVAFEFQIVKELDKCEHDVFMDYLITESRVLNFKH